MSQPLDPNRSRNSSVSGPGEMAASPESTGASGKRRIQSESDSYRTHPKPDQPESRRASISSNIPPIPDTAKKMIGQLPSGHRVSRTNSLDSTSSNDFFDAYTPEEMEDIENGEFEDANDVFESEVNAENLVEHNQQDIAEASLSPKDNVFDKRSVTEQPPKEGKGWFGFSWLPIPGFRNKTNDERSVSEVPTSPDTPYRFNRALWAFAKWMIPDSWRLKQGFNALEFVHNSLQTVSTVYHNAKNKRKRLFQGVTSEFIHFPPLTFSSVAGEGRDLKLDGVVVKIESVKPMGTGTGDDQFKKLQLSVRLYADASIGAEGANYEGNVAFEHATVNIYFNRGGVIRKLIESGTVTGTLYKGLMNVHRPRDSFIPERIEIHPGENSTCFTASSSTGSRGKVDLQMGKMTLYPSKQLENTGRGLQAELHNVSVKGEGQKILSFLPDDLHTNLSEFLPCTAHSDTEVEVDMGVLALRMEGKGKMAACPDMKVRTKGEIGIKEGRVKGLVAATVTNSKTEETEAAVGFDQIEAEQIAVNQATFKLPYDIQGPAKFTKGMVYFNSGHTTPKGKPPANSQLKVEVKTVEADFSGGLEFKGEIQKLGACMDFSESGQVQVHAEEGTAEHFVVGSGIESAAKSRLLEGRDCHFEGLGIAMGPEPEAPSGSEKAKSQTAITVDKLQMKKVEGLAYTQEAELSEVRLTHKAAAEEMCQDIRLTAEAVDASQYAIPEQATAGIVKAQMDKAHISKLDIACKIKSSFTTEAEKQQHEQTMSRPVEHWQVPETWVVAATAKIDADHISGDIEATVNLPNAATDQPLPRTTGTAHVSKPELAVVYDADQGVESAKLDVASATLGLDQGDIRGDVGTKGFHTDYHTGTDQAPNITVINIEAGSASGSKLTASDALIPTGMTASTGFSVTEPKAKLELKTVQSTDGTPGANHLQASAEVKDSEVRLDLDIEPDTVLPTSAVDKIKEYRTMLPERCEAQIARELDLLETLPVEPDQNVRLPKVHQTVEVKAKDLGVTATSGEDQKLELATENVKVTMPKGLVEGEVSIHGIEAQTYQAGDTLETALAVDEITVDHMKTRGPATVELQSPAQIKGVNATFSKGSDFTHTHADVDSVDLDMTAGVKGVITEGPEQGQELKPAKIKLKASRLNINAQQDIEGTLASGRAGKIELAVEDVRDQLGVALDADVHIKDGLAAVQTTEQSLRVDVEADRVKLKTSGDLNGDITLQSGGLTLVHDETGLKVNTRVDSQKSRINFSDPARQLLQILTRKNIDQSPLGKACDLDFHPNLDDSLTGDVSVSMKGFVSPLIGLGLSLIGNRPTRILLHLAQFLSFRLEFGIKVKKLPVKKGRISLRDILQHTHIVISSHRGVLGQIYAWCTNITVNYIALPLAVNTVRLMKLIDGQTGEITLTSLASIVDNKVKLVSKDSLPAPVIGKSGDILTDAHNYVLLGKAVPTKWEDGFFLRGIEQRVKKIRWHGKPLAQHLDKPALNALCQQIASDSGCPSRLEDFQQIDSLFTLFKEELRRSSADHSSTDSPVLLYQKAHEKLKQQAAVEIEDTGENPEPQSPPPSPSVLRSPSSQTSRPVKLVAVGMDKRREQDRKKAKVLSPQSVSEDIERVLALLKQHEDKFARGKERTRAKAAVKKYMQRGQQETNKLKAMTEQQSHQNQKILIELCNELNGVLTPATKLLAKKQP